MKQLTHDSTHFENQKFPIILFLDGLTSPANIGGIFRLADAFGVRKIILSNCDFQPQSSRFKRTARHTETQVAFEVIEEPLIYLKELKDQNYQIISLEITDDSVPLQTLDVLKTRDTVIIVGAERRGISQDLLKLSDMATHITMFGNNSSMNVAQALGIALFQITKTLTPQVEN